LIQRVAARLDRPVVTTNSSVFRLEMSCGATLVG
jgi:hypothetical protein